MSSRMKVVGAAAVAFFGIVLVARATGVAGVVWNAETTNEWFTASTSSLDGWVPPSDGDASADGSTSTIVFDTEVSDPLRYEPASASDPVALVNVRMVVDPNASTPSTTGLEAAQAALSVVTNASGYLEWVGLTKTSNSVLAWVPLSGDHPTVGATYDVQIAVDNHGDTKRIRYAVKASDTSTYANLTYGGKEWLDNPQSGKSSVEKVAFAGAGTIKSLNGDNIVEVGPSITVNPFDNSAAYDFTNGTITAVVSIPSGEYDGKTAVLTITNLRTSEEQAFEAVNVTGSSVAMNLGDLTAGDMYSYTVSVKYDGVERAVKAGTFVAANWSDACLFGGVVAGSTENVTNGVMSGAVAADSKWNVLTNAQFKVDDTTAGAGKVTRVDTSYSFETFIDTDSLETLPDAVGGIVAVSNGADPAWYAYTPAEPGDGVFNGWQKLKGDIVPATNTEYVIRAEFDFQSATHGVSYYVAEAGGASFYPLTLGNNIMIGLTKTTNTLSSVGMEGKGSVKSICANIADASIAEVNGVKYTSLWEAVKAAKGGMITLLTNATLKPNGVTGGKYGFRLTGGDYILDTSEVPGAWKVVEKNGVLYLMRPAATYIFF